MLFDRIIRLCSRRIIGRSAIVAIGALGIAAGQTSCASEAAQVSAPQTASGEGLRAFQSDEELATYLERLRERNARERRQSNEDIVMYDAEGAVAELAPAPASVAPADGESITNNQTAGVDEGGIVKARGDMLVVLRRGRLFTISTANGEMRTIDHIDAFPPGAGGGASWYDEMLIAGDRVIVIGYSYPRGGTEVNRFRLSEDGQLSFEDAHHLRSNDYYSADNYASRLIGTELIFYTPLNLYHGENPLEALPGVKRWNANGESAFDRIAGPGEIFVTDDIFNDEEGAPSTLHSVTRCDVASDDFDCSATGVIAGWSREFYVSRDAVYLWIADGNSYGARSEGQEAHIYRLPLDGARPSAIGARGMPIDQFSFLEQPDQGRLNVLVTDQGTTPMIELPRGSTGAINLIQVPLADFGDGSSDVADRHYRQLGFARGSVWEMENRYVGDHIVYGYGRMNGYGRSDPRVFAAALGGGAATEIEIGHGVERIEQLGSDAVVIGSGLGNKLGFSAIALTDGDPHIADRYTLPAAGQGESRSHAYFYRPDTGSAGGASGTLGLPIARQVEPRFRQLLGSSAAMLFLRRNDRQFSLAGELGAEVEGVVDDNCQASCVDWYGNARPIFLRDRIFALLGYELVEGRMDGGRISEIGRLDYAPRPADPAG